ncbi:tRNA1(Val) (adenine(37)-N6)-methyltransferase [Lederbergia sp. NSJ-179]|uniref:tRNA1(Val) (adenine(37)-N6)-methyltransferase n=1 Tax=Lederbergia sp. NSJ-179 TaxID=2931402 RepID=UPI001FD2B17C|nr:tRNA1(Val) (adenine(37)-N6)-methyltransferase [Lederbergia sp. NSJ-179]MCJ7842926.1 tRNA1(Val) (adenine(37)-N6)-methyltransferase [Lederbergia sp. NSJ-179]
MVELLQDERLDYLLAEDLRIIQSPSVFAFSLDAVLLSRFTYLPIQKGKIIDLCSGNGVVPLLLSNRTKAAITGVEIQERLYDMAKRSISYNQLDSKIHMIHGDLKAMPTFLGFNQFDLVTCNPPYFPSQSPEIRNQNEHLAIARHEIYCTLEDVVKCSSQLLKQGGKASFVHRPERLMDLITYMRSYRLEPKRLRFVYPKEGKEANTILVEGIKDSRPGLKVLPPLFVYDHQNEYTEEVRDLLYGSGK